MRKRLRFENPEINNMYNIIESEIISTVKRLKEWNNANFFKKIWLTLSLKFPLEDDEEFIKQRMNILKRMTELFDYTKEEVSDENDFTFKKD